MQQFDVAIIGAGAAGLFCAGVAGQQGRKVLLLDHSPRVAEKIRISGGGRCNFTNREVGPQNFLSENPHFCRSALAGYTPQDFLSLVAQHGVAWHEKHKGQLFCDRRSEDIIQLLLRECEQGQVTRWQPCEVLDVRRTESTPAPCYELDTSNGPVRAARLVVATGGLSIPKIGASDFGHRLAQCFGHTIVPLRPALVPLTFAPQVWAPWAPLSGVSLPVAVSVPQHGKRKAHSRTTFHEDLLFTHRGLSGPAILQISSYWTPGDTLSIDLAPGTSLASALKASKVGSRRQLSSEWAAALGNAVPQRLAQAWLDHLAQTGLALGAQAPLAELKDKDLEALGRSANEWQLLPDGNEGYAKAEVTAGGVDTRELSSRTMESQRTPGLHFIGEVVDVTGWLGGYNFQWAWASAMACAKALAA